MKGEETTGVSFEFSKLICSRLHVCTVILCEAHLIVCCSTFVLVGARGHAAPRFPQHQSPTP